jgi:hypothetical protein
MAKKTLAMLGTYYIIITYTREGIDSTPLKKGGSK